MFSALTLAPPHHAPPPAATTGMAGFVAGTRIMTLAGEVPVEQLVSGNRVVTRNSGIARLAAVDRVDATLSLICFHAGSLGHRRPQEDTFLGPATKVLIRDWRAPALYGQPSAMIEASRLVDGCYIARREARRITLYLPRFDAPHVIYAGGLEIGLD